MRGWILAAALGAVTVGAHAEACKPLQMMGSITLSADANTRRLYVPVEIAGVKKRLLLDTGAAQTEISEATAKELNLPLSAANVRTIGVTGASTDKFTTAETKIGTLGSGKLQFMVSPALNDFDEPDVAGLFGAEILSLFDVSIDPANLKLDLINPDHCADRVIYWPAPAVTKLDLARVRSTALIVNITIDGKLLKAILDTGAYNSTIRIDAAKRLFDIVPGSADTPTSGHLNERADLTTYHHVFKTLAFKGVSVSNPEFDLIPDRFTKEFLQTSADTRIVTADTSVAPDVLLGMNILKHLHLYIAYKARTLYITPADPPQTKPAN
jgi:predicted aspartyl protease